MINGISIKSSGGPGYASSFKLRTKMFLLFGGLFAITFLLGILADLYGVPFTSFRGEFGLQQEEVFQHLNLVADLKKDRLLRWIDERKKDVAIQAKSHHMVEDAWQLREVIRNERLSSPDEARMWSNVKQTFIYRYLLSGLLALQSAYEEYGPVSIVDRATGEVIISSNINELGKICNEPFILDSDFLDYLDDTYVSDVMMDDHLGAVTLHFVHLIHPGLKSGASETPSFAMLVVHVFTDKVLSPILHTGGGLGNTGEVVLVNRNREILTHLKRPLADGREAMPLEYKIGAMPATLAARGKEGLITSKDYRGEPVLAAYRYLQISSEIGWGMVTKMDESEAYAPLRQILSFSLIAGGVGIVFILGFVIIISRNLSRPITKLSQVAEKIEAGNLHARAPYTGGDEVGLLGRAFNSMIGQIQHWHSELEEQVKTRTTELESRNKELRVEIRERARAEKALIKSENRLRSIIAKSPIPMAIVDKNQTMEYLNDKFTELFGYDIKDIPKAEEWWIKAYPDPDYRAMVHNSWEKAINVALETKTEIDIQEFNLTCKDGTVKNVQANLTVLEDMSVIVMNDITEMRRLQDLEARAQRLEAAGQIAGQVAHDFNNLLTPLVAYPDFIREELPKDHPILPYLDNIENSALQIAEINQQLLTLGRRGHYNQEPLNMNEVVMEVIDVLKPLPESLALNTQLNENLMNIMAGRAQIHRVLYNLIINARDAVQDIGQISIKTGNYYVDDVSVAYGRVPKGEYIKLTVEDSGHGIPDNVIQHIFDPFYTTKTTDKRRGSGLGLSIVDAVVKDHKGFIDLKSINGKGTSFYLYFPVTREAIERHDSEEIIGGNESVLVIDDDSVQRDVLLKLLKGLGYRASATISGEDAIRFLLDNPQDLLILDMIMPQGIDGTETYHRVLKINPAQKAIIVSGFAEGSKVKAALDMGAGAFIRKPIGRKTLASAVRKELDREKEMKTH